MRRWMYIRVERSSLLGLGFLVQYTASLMPQAECLFLGTTTVMTEGVVAIVIGMVVATESAVGGTGKVVVTEITTATTVISLATTLAIVDGPIGTI
jgi:hypothetical protein